MILCLDYGSRYIGAAITDPDERLALRHGVIDQKQADALTTIKNIVASERVTKILIGLPISLSGNVSAQTKITQEFIEKLTMGIDPAIPVVSVDETLTSYEAERRIKDEGGNKNDAHAEAARIMLEDFLAHSH